MRKHAPLVALLVVAAAMTGVPTLARQSKDHGPIPWLTSFAKGKKEAAKQKKPMMVDYYANWCPPCRAMMATTYKDKAVVAKAKRFVPVLLDIEKNKKQTEAANVESIPTVVFYNSHGKEILRSVGYLEPTDLLKLMDDAIKRAAK